MPPVILDPVPTAVDAVPGWLRTLPKIELHVHLEGTLRPATVLRLTEKHRLDNGFSSVADIRDRYRFTSLTHFIETFTLVCECLRTPEDIAVALREYGDELLRQNVMYAELHLNPEPHLRKRGIDPVDLFAAIGEVRSDFILDHGLMLNWICDGIRDADCGPGSAEVTVDVMVEIGHGSGIVALGLGGDENGYPLEDFVRPFARARSAGFQTVAHAGESTGPEMVRRTIELLAPTRIGHGVSAARDRAVIDLLAEQGIAVELCPTSNVCTGAIPSIHDLPLTTFQDAGVRVSINSDDPPMFGTTVLGEYVAIARAFDLGPADMARLVRSGIDQSFADASTRTTMHARLRDWETANLR